MAIQINIVFAQVDPTLVGFNCAIAGNVGYSENEPLS